MRYIAKCGLQTSNPKSKLDDDKCQNGRSLCLYIYVSTGFGSDSIEIKTQTTMVNYKLTYFDGRGLAEATRQVFHLADVPFEDIRIKHGDGTWEELKPKTPFGQMPVLSVDGFEIPQSMAILRYVARKYGYAGKTPEEEAWVDAIVDQFKDFMSSFRQFIYATRQNKSVEEIEQIKKDVAIPARDNYFKIITGILETSKSGFLVGDSLTFADLVVVESLFSLQNHAFFTKQDYPKIAELEKKVQTLPKLKEYLASRPVTPF